MAFPSARAQLSLSLLILAVALTAPTPARAHIQMNYPPTRTNMVQMQSILPCGGLPPMTTPTPVQTGSTLQIQWVELIVHPGWYRISLASNPNGPFTSAVLMDHIPSVDGTTAYNQNITLPTTSCPECTLQLIQVNTSGPDSTTPSGYIEYAACADLNINPNATVPGTTGTTGGTGTGSTTGTGVATTTTGGGSNTPVMDGPGGCSAGDASSWGVAALLWLGTRWFRRRASA